MFESSEYIVPLLSIGAAIASGLVGWFLRDRIGTVRESYLESLPLERPEQLDQLKNHNDLIKELVMTETGRENLATYVLYELALQGEIEGLLDEIENLPPMEIDADLVHRYANREPNLSKSIERGKTARAVAKTLFNKINSTLTSSASSIIGLIRGKD